MKTNKLPQKRTMTLNLFSGKKVNRVQGDTDTTGTSLSTLTSTHIFNK